MKTFTTTPIRWIGMLAAAFVLAAVFSLLAAAAPVQAATLPPTTCAYDGGSNTRSCTLVAKPGTLSLPGGAPAVNFWGFASSAGAAASLPGPTLVMNLGEVLNLDFTNSLTAYTQAVSLAIPGVDGIPDLVGVTPGNSKTYSFTPASAGTYLYQAGLTPDGATQVAMGLYGVLVVRPAGAAAQAYAADSAFDDEALLVFSEIDPAFSNSANPYNFDIRNFHSRFWLVNGKAYPETAEIPSAPNRRVLLRMVNSGSFNYTLGLLGTRQRVVGRNAQRETYPKTVVNETLGAGQTLDTIVTVPAAATPGTKFAIYESGFKTHNNGALVSSSNLVAYGGMLTHIVVTGTPSTADTRGPLTTSLTATPAVGQPGGAYALTATVSETSTGNAPVNAVEYFYDHLGPPGTGTPITVAVPAVTVNLNHALPASETNGLTLGEHRIYLRGRDSLGNWGPVNSASLTITGAGAQIIQASASPSPTNGTVDVAIDATADNRLAGLNIVAGEFFIDNPGANGTGKPMALNSSGQQVGLSATLTAAQVNALTEGLHTIYIHARDTANQWGDFGTALLKVDKTGPLVFNFTVAPNPNNGFMATGSFVTPSIRADAIANDPNVRGVNASIERVEGFIDTVGAPGTGFMWTPGNGIFRFSVEPTFSNIPLTGISNLPDGPHTLYVRAKDTAGNWGPLSSTILVIDKRGPDITGLRAFPNPTCNLPTVEFSGTMTDPTSGAPTGRKVVTAEYFITQDNTPGFNTPLVAPANSTFDAPSVNFSLILNTADLAQGANTVSFRAKDEFDNWGPVSKVVVYRWDFDCIYNYLPDVSK